MTRILLALGALLALSVVLVGALPAAVDAEDHHPVLTTEPMRYHVCQLEGAVEVCIDSTGVYHANTGASGVVNYLVVQRMCVVFTDAASGRFLEENCHSLSNHILTRDGQTEVGRVFTTQFIRGSGQTYCARYKILVVGGEVRIQVEDIDLDC